MRTALAGTILSEAYGWTGAVPTPWARLSSARVSLSIPDFFSGQSALELASAGAVARLNALSGECQPEFQARGLALIAGELRDAGHVPLASQIYTWLEKTLADRPEPWSAEVAATAAASRNAMAGAGGSGARAEFLISRFADTAFDPGFLAGFAAGSWASGATRLFSLSRMAASAPGLLTRGVGARWAASSLAATVEIPTLIAAKTAVDFARGKDIPRSAAEYGREAFSFGVTLGFLRMAGGAAKLAGKISPLGNAWVAQDAAMVAGAFLAQATLDRIQGVAADSGRNWVDALAFFVHAKIGARWGERLLGGRFGYSIRGLEKALSEHVPFRRPDVLSEPQWIMATGFDGDGPRRPSSFPQPLRIVSGPAPGVAEVTSIVRQRLVQRLKKDLHDRLKLSPEVMTAVLEQFQKTKFSFDSDSMLKRYYEMLAKIHVDNAILEGQPVPRETILLDALHAFRRVTELDTSRTTVGSFYDHLLHVALERTLLQQDAGRFHDLVRIAGLTRTMEGLQVFLGESPAPLRAADRKKNWEGRIGGFNIPERESVVDYLATLPFIAPLDGAAEAGKLVMRGPNGKRETKPWDVQAVLKALEAFVMTYQPGSETMIDFSLAVEEAKRSLVPHLVMERIFKVLAAGSFPEKLREIHGWDDLDLDGLRAKKILTPLTSNFLPAGSRINGGIHTGFVRDLPLAAKVAEFYSLLPIYLKPENQREHWAETVGFARRRLEEAEERQRREKKPLEQATFGKDEVLEMLYMRPTGLSRQARQAILKGEVDFEVLSKNGMQALWESLDHADRALSAPKAFFADAKKTKTGRPLIAIRELDPDLSREEKARMAVLLGGRAVHEFEHYLHHKELTFNSRPGVLKAEMRSNVEEMLYYLAHGYLPKFEEMQRLSPYGIGIFYRNAVEHEYLEDLPDFIKK